MATPRALWALFLFDEPLGNQAPSVISVLGSVPKFWDVTQQERELIGVMFQKPLRQSPRSLLFSLPVVGGDHERMLELVRELGVRASGRKVLLPSGAGSASIGCSMALGGTEDEVRQWSERHTVNVAEYNSRLAALDGLLTAESAQERLFAELALDAISDAKAQGQEVDWHVVEARFMMCCEGVAPSQVLATLVNLSPGAASLLRRTSLEREVSSIQSPAGKSEGPGVGPAP